MFKSEKSSGKSVKTKYQAKKEKTEIELYVVMNKVFYEIVSLYKQLKIKDDYVFLTVELIEHDDAIFKEITNKKRILKSGFDYAEKHKLRIKDYSIFYN